MNGNANAENPGGMPENGGGQQNDGQQQQQPQYVQQVKGEEQQPQQPESTIGGADYAQQPQMYNQAQQQQQTLEQQKPMPLAQAAQNYTPLTTAMTQRPDAGAFLRCRGLPYSASENEVRKFFGGLFHVLN